MKLDMAFLKQTGIQVKKQLNYPALQRWGKETDENRALAQTFK
jgi:hypothetical protein